MQQSTQSAGSETAPNRVLDHGLHRLHLNHYHLLRPIKELRASDRPENLLQEWRAVQKPSQEWRNALFFDRALVVLSTAMSVTRPEAERMVEEYVAGGR